MTVPHTLVPLWGSELRVFKTENRGPCTTFVWCLELCGTLGRALSTTVSLDVCKSCAWVGTVDGDTSLGWSSAIDPDSSSPMGNTFCVGTIVERYLENLAPLASYAITVLFRTVVCVSVCVCCVCARYNKYVSIDGIYPITVGSRWMGLLKLKQL